METDYPWRLPGCPYGDPVTCPCIRDSKTFFTCSMSVGSYKEQQKALKRFEAEND